MRGAATNEKQLEARNMVQQALGITRADATNRCRRYDDDDFAAIHAAEGEPELLEAIAAAEQKASDKLQGIVTEAHRKAQQQEKEEGGQKVPAKKEKKTKAKDKPPKTADAKPVETVEPKPEPKAPAANETTAQDPPAES